MAAQPLHPNVVTPPSPLPRLVLDTNVCLDWLVFHDPGFQTVQQTILLGQTELLASARMRAELQHMLGHRSLARWRPDAAAALAEYDRHTRLLAEPPSGAASRLRCTDADDQVFIDLALAERASALLTHDRALLKLGRRARSLGVQILRPADWRPGADQSGLAGG